MLKLTHSMYILSALSFIVLQYLIDHTLCDFRLVSGSGSTLSQISLIIFSCIFNSNFVKSKNLSLVQIAG